MEEAIDFLKEDMFREKMKWESNYIMSSTIGILI
jgi:hypothetical protein